MKRETSALTALLQSVMRLHPKRMPSAVGGVGAAHHVPQAGPTATGMGAIDLALHRIERLLEKLGSPQQQLPPTIHIAGTNGKGSTLAFTVAMLRSIRKENGQPLLVHHYSSPHLVRFNERIFLANEEVDDERLMAAMQYVLAMNQDEEITFFELTTAAAFWLFACTTADVLVCEVGLGGRLDSTNVITDDKLVVFTPIDLDHQEFLGNTIEKIATEKAGVITPNTRAIISAPQQPAAMAILEHSAAQMDRKIIVPSFGCDDKGALWLRPQPAMTATNVADDGGITPMLLGRPALLGAHQYTNGAVAGQAVLAFMAIFGPRLLRGDGARLIDRTKQQKTQQGGNQFMPRAMPQVTARVDEAIKTGLATAQWAGRLQPFDAPQLVGLPQNINLWVDGCHNPHGARALAAWLQQWLADNSDKNIALVVALLSNRKADDFMAAFEGLDKKRVDFFPTSFISADHQPHDPQHLAQVAAALGFRITPTASWRQAMAIIGQQAVTRGYGGVVVGGSLYLIGQMLESVPLTR